jgi:hypothetical protein
MQEAFLMSAPGFGMLIGYVPLSFWVRKSGSRVVISAMLGFSAACILVQPTLISFGEFK